MVLPAVVSMDEVAAPLQWTELPEPLPAEEEVLIQVAACGVCHTELDEIEGRTAPPRLPIVLGHEVVGTVAAAGRRAQRFPIGARVGVGWIHCSTGQVDENLSPQFIATGRDVNGGYAEFMTVPEAYAYAIPDVYSDAEAAPLLCAGGIGYRALRLTNIRDGDRLGLTGFGASAHLVLQLTQALFPQTAVHVFARDPAQREFARQLGAAWAGDSHDQSPQPLQAIIDTTPAWQPVVAALENLCPGGRLVINAIRKEDSDKSALLELVYERHLWMEKEIKTVANITHLDIAEFLPVAASVPIRPDVTTYPLEEANQALMQLKRGGLRGAIVLTM